MMIYHRKRSYKAYLASKTWHTKRAAALQRAGQRCQWVIEGERCAATVGLHVHHVTYKHFGRERAADLLVLCRAHHEYVHGRKIGR